MEEKQKKKVQNHMIDACVFVMTKQNTTRNERKRARGK